MAANNLDEPFLLIVAGPNGSGKTTLIESLRKQSIDFGEYINPDDIAAELTGSYEQRVLQAQSIADERRNACIEARRSFSFETVMSHPSKLDTLVEAKEAGFFVQLFFVGIDDPNTNVERVAIRVAQGGHSVPTDKIISRWKRTMEQLHEAIRTADEAYVFDNSAAGTIETIPRLVFRRSFIQKRNLPKHEEYPPIPSWVRQYVLKPLGIGSPGTYSSFSTSRVMRSVITAVPESDERHIETDTPAGFRAMPLDLEMEQAVLGSILLDNDSFYKVCNFLNPTQFSEPIHKRIFELAGTLIGGGRQATSDTLRSMLPADIEIAGFTVGEYLNRLTATACRAVDIERLGRTLLDLAIRRELIFMCEDISRDAYKAPHDFDLRQLIMQAERRLFELGGPAQYDSNGLNRISNALSSAIDSMARAYSSDREISGIATGLKDLDRITRGLQNSDLIVIGGQAGVGKTTLAANIAYNIAKAWKGEVSTDGKMATLEGGIVGFFSLDMSAEQLATNIIAGRAEVPIRSIVRGAIGDSDFDRIATVAREIETIPLYIDDTGTLSAAHIAARARRLKRLRGLDLIVVDNVQTVERNKPDKESDYDQNVDNIFIALKSLAKELNIPVIGISRLAVPHRRDSHTDMTPLRTMGPVAQHADLVMIIVSEEYDLAQGEPALGTDAHLRWIAEMEAARGNAEIIIAKHRHGPTGTVTVHYSSEIGRFSDLGS